MIASLTRLEHKIGDRVYHLTCDPNSPTVEVKEALCKFLQFVGSIEDNNAAKMKEQEEASKTSEEAPEDGLHDAS